MYPLIENENNKTPTPETLFILYEDHAEASPLDEPLSEMPKETAYEIFLFFIEQEDPIIDNATPEHFQPTFDGYYIINRHPDQLNSYVRSIYEAIIYPALFLRGLKNIQKIDLTILPDLSDRKAVQEFIDTLYSIDEDTRSPVVQDLMIRTNPLSIFQPQQILQ